MGMLAIPAGSCREGAVADFIAGQLQAAGADVSMIRRDQAHRRSLHGGETGNLVFKLPGTARGPRRLLMAHMDTVPLCVGARPVRRGEWIYPAHKTTGLGADDRAGAAAVLSAALEILGRGLPHPPLTFLWTVQEEVGLYGARHASLGFLGRPASAYNFDGSSPEEITIGATGGYRMRIHVRGAASHAGVAPEKGVSAIAIAALAIADLVRAGWHGRVEKSGSLGTSNVGVIRGGEATNVVASEVEVLAEARSHDPLFRARIVRAVETAFQDAARAVCSAEGKCGEIQIEGHADYESFRLADDEPCVVEAEAAVRAAGGTPVRAISNGGLDANWMNRRGIPTVTLGAGAVNVHTTQERLDLARFRMACRIALGLATGGAT
jgi:tripeptide aminopeptidase